MPSKNPNTPQGPQPRRSNRQRGKQPDGSDNAALVILGRKGPPSKDTDPPPKATAPQPTSPKGPAPSKGKKTHEEEHDNAVVPSRACSMVETALR